ncbi:MAG TPA: hypothetical protein PKO33_18090, partial [Pyrinomonadaceae bacterium]|nr:hypothetical protein [Pyrinomonadaceae bacterium]
LKMATYGRKTEFNWTQVIWDFGFGFTEAASRQLPLPGLTKFLRSLSFPYRNLHCMLVGRPRA